jgi:hypothetical protein
MEELRAAFSSWLDPQLVGAFALTWQPPAVQRAASSE